jgi:hypothetical protein
LQAVCLLPNIATDDYQGLSSTRKPSRSDRPAASAKLDHCHQTIAQDWLCEVEDGIATPWSGGTPQPMTARLAEGVATVHGSALISKN